MRKIWSFAAETAEVFVMRIWKMAINEWAEGNGRDSEGSISLEFEYNFVESGDKGWKAWRKLMAYF